jgi:hypothetical protein
VTRRTPDGRQGRLRRTRQICGPAGGGPPFPRLRIGSGTRQRSFLRFPWEISSPLFDFSPLSQHLFSLLEKKWHFYWKKTLHFLAKE